MLETLETCLLSRRPVLWRQDFLAFSMDSIMVTLELTRLGLGTPDVEGECNNVISTKYPIQANLRGIEDLW